MKNFSFTVKKGVNAVYLPFVFKGDCKAKVFYSFTKKEQWIEAKTITVGFEPKRTVLNINIVNFTDPQIYPIYYKIDITGDCQEIISGQVYYEETAVSLSDMIHDQILSMMSTSPSGETAVMMPGPKGDKGDQGVPGVGTEGKEGPTGPQGDVGLQGDIGPQGIAGERGPKGLQGEAGPKGDQGIPGDKGEHGLQGVPGPTGPKGDIGPQGIPGPKGETGQTGAKGDTGLAGPKGDQGATGEKGEAGPQGIQGPAGVKGNTGESIGISKGKTVVTLSTLLGLGASTTVVVNLSPTPPAGYVPVWSIHGSMATQIEVSNVVTGTSSVTFSIKALAILAIGSTCTIYVHAA